LPISKPPLPPLQAVPVQLLGASAPFPMKTWTMSAIEWAVVDELALANGVMPAPVGMPNPG
jgi:hypothetical protein